MPQRWSQQELCLADVVSWGRVLADAETFTHLKA